MGIATARKQAMSTIAAIQAGADPVAEKQSTRRTRAGKSAEVTVAERLQEWQRSREADKVDPWSDRYASEVRRVCDQAVVPTLGKLPLRETTREDWTKILRNRQKSGPGAAAFLYRTCSSFLNYAEAHGWIPLPLLPRKGATTIAPPVASRARVLTDEELTAVWRASETEPVKLRAFTRLLILTAARELEVADIATGELDLKAGRWTIPDHRAKNGLAITLPLSDLALAELQPVWPEQGTKAGDDWRLLGKIAGTGFRGFGRLKTRLDEASGVQGWRWHDLRRTARTGMTRLGVPREHAEAAINHVSGRTALERTYDRHDYAPEVIAALGKWQDHVAELVKVQESTSKVVPIRGAGRG
jgi:integrase